MKAQIVNARLATTLLIFAIGGAGSALGQTEVTIGDAMVIEGGPGAMTEAVFLVTVTTVVIGVTRSPFTITLSTRDDTASAADGDYLPLTGFSLEADDSFDATYPVSVFINGDSKVEAGERFFLDITDGGGAVVLDGEGEGTIQNDDATQVSIGDATVTEGDSGTVDANFAVSLTALSDFPVTVDVATSDGSATVADGDYQAAAVTSFTIPAGMMSQTFTVVVNSDLLVEADETFSVDLSNPDGATLGDGNGEGRILNDDAASLSIDDVVVVEGDAGTVDAIFTVTLSKPSTQTVTVDFVTGDGTATLADGDYQAAAGTLTFDPGEVSQPLAVTINGDTVVEPDETVLVDLSSPVGATIADPQGEATIQDDDMTGLSIDDVTLVEGATGTTAAIFTVTLSLPNSDPVTVDVATRDGTATVADGDYAMTTATPLTFAAHSTTQTFTVPVNGDIQVETDEQFFVDLTNPNGAAIVDGVGMATIQDDDVAGLSIGDVTVDEGDSGTVDAVFTVTLSKPSALPVTVDVATFDATAKTSDGDYQATASTLTFPPGSTTQTFTVPVNGDHNLEPDERFRATLSNPDGAALGDRHGGATIRNDDEAPSVIRFGSAPAPAVGEGSGSVALTVRRSGGAAAAAAVTVVTGTGTATAGEDFTGLSQRLTWAAGESGAKTFELEILDDNLEEGDENVPLRLTAPSGASLGEPRRLVVTIRDDDQPTLLEPVGETARTEKVNQAIDLQVRATRDDGTPVQGASVVWSVPAGDAELLGENPTPTDVEGLASQQVELGGSPGPVTVRAEIPETGQVVSFEIVVEGDLDELFDPLLNPAEAAVAQALNDACNEAQQQFAELCDYIFGLDRGDQQEVIGELTPVEAGALADLLLQSPSAQLLNLRRHLAARRGGGPGSQIALGLTGQSVPLDVLRQAFAGEVEVMRKMATRIDAAMFQRQEEQPPEPPPAADEGGSRFNFFASGQVDVGDRPGSELEAGYDLDTLGLTIGLDYQAGPRVIVGGALGYVDTDTKVHGDGGGIDVKGYSLSGFVTYFRDKFWLDGILSYGSNDYDFVRHIDLPQPFQGQSRLAARGRPGGSQVAIDFGGGYDASFGATSLSGFGRLSYIDAELDGFTEQGAGPFSLILQGQQIESLLLEAGFEVVWASSRPWGVLQPMVRASLLHEFEDDSRTIIAGFAADPGNNLFQLPTDRPDRDFYRLGAGVTATLARGRGLYLLYETDLAREDLDLYRLSAGLRLEF